MPIAALILVEPAQAGNLGAAMRVAANFSVPRLELVRPLVDPYEDEVIRWACNAHERLEITTWQSFGDAASAWRTVIATASARGRDNQPVISPQLARRVIAERAPASTALVFGNETRGLRREEIDRCDLTIRIPTDAAFPVLNLTQAIAIMLGYLAIESADPLEDGPLPAPQDEVDGLMDHLHTALDAIGFLDPLCPHRVLRKLRRLFGRAGITSNEVAILRGVCRQSIWAARNAPLAHLDDSRRASRSR